MAVDLGDDAWEERVVVQLHRSAKVANAGPDGDAEARERSQRAYWEFHGSLLSGCGSPLMIQLLGDIGCRLERYVNLFADRESDIERDTRGEHRQIVDAVVARDTERVLSLIDRYFASAQPMRDTIIETLKRNEQGQSRRRGGGRAAGAAPRRPGKLAHAAE
jgi:GntR family carbon starvation induced transcriptional regulator